MDHRLYFVIGDLLANILVGLFVGWITWLLVSPGWNMWLAMVVMMVLGMVLAGLLFLPLGVFLGAMEVMIPTMLGGMLSGMVIGMWCAMAPLSGPAATALGGACGLLAIVAVWIANHSLRGSRSVLEGQSHGG